jgi:hypothetical protein
MKTLAYSRVDTAAVARKRKNEVMAKYAVVLLTTGLT